MAQLLERSSKMFYENADFYPTPDALAARMVDMIDTKRVHFVLEPSAGKGDLVDKLKSKMRYDGYSNITGNHGSDVEIDCIEQDGNLQNLLKGAGKRLIFDDFLKFETLKKYDLILMNPPFSEGDKHLLKALEMMKNGGQVVCLLNAETLKNPYTNIRKVLNQKLAQLGAEIKYLDGAFTQAERVTNVEVALIYVDIPAREPVSLILESLEKASEMGIADFTADKEITFYELLKRMVYQFNLEAKAGIKLINEYCRLQPYLMNRLDTSKDKYAKPIFEIRFDDKDWYSGRAANMVNQYLKKLRYKYWYALGDNPNFRAQLTSNLANIYYQKLLELSDYDFNLHNIEQVNKELQSRMTAAVEDTILALFDELSDKYSWYPECTKNIHYYNGWRTNIAHMINKKVIIPMQTTDSWDNEIDVTKYSTVRKINDIEKVMDYLNDGRVAPYISIDRVLQTAKYDGQTRNIESKYFTLTFYKKGTVHLTFKNAELLKKFNIFGSQKKAWLPPCYGKKHYDEMTPEEKQVINEFEGSALEYEKTLAEKDYYLRDATDLITIA